MLRPGGLLSRTARRMGTRRWARSFLGPKVLTRLDRVVHRLTGGRRRAADLLFPSLMLTTTGRRSGRPHRVPLARLELDGVPVVIGSNFGHDQHPAWSENLLAEPRALVERGGASIPIVARPLTAEERERVWPRAIAIWPGYDTYRQATRGIREIRMFALEPDPEHATRGG